MTGTRWNTRGVLARAAAAIGVALALAVADGAAGATARLWYVDGSAAACSDADGSARRPFCTIGAAAAGVAAGQTVVVAAGVYTERIVIPASGTRARPIVFTTAPRAVVVVTGGQNGFVVRDQSWIRINGFAVTATSEYGIAVANAAHVTLSNNRVTFAGKQARGEAKYGIRLGNVHDSVVVGNVVAHNTSAGIALVAGSTRNEVRANRTFDNAKGFERAAVGIRLYAAPGNIVDRNVAFGNEDSGIELDASPANLVYDNLTYSNGDHGIDVTGFSTTGRILSNTVFDNVTAGINVEGGSTGATLANNISVDNGVDSPRTDGNIRVEAGSTAETSLDYDLVDLSGGDTTLIWGSVDYGSVAALAVATGQEEHGVEGRPRWRNPAAGDFRLTASSLAIDSATSRPRGHPPTDIERRRRVDVPSMPNRGGGPRTYDDRGAYEYQSRR